MNLPIWDDRYDRMGVSAHELYLRQNNLCYLVVDGPDDDRVSLLYRWKRRARTDRLLNPTFECARCMSSFIVYNENNKNK